MEKEAVVEFFKIDQKMREEAKRKKEREGRKSKREISRERERK